MSRNQGDLGFRVVTGAFAVLVVAIVAGIGVVLTTESWLSIQKFGLGFWTTSTWDPVVGDFGALRLIWGTLSSSILALLIGYLWACFEVGRSPLAILKIFDSKEEPVVAKTPEKPKDISKTAPAPAKKPEVTKPAEPAPVKKPEVAPAPSGPKMYSAVDMSILFNETDDLLRSSTFSREAVSHVSREMPKMNVQVVAEGPERLIHAPSGMEFPLSSGPETTIGRKDAVTGIYPDVDLSPLDQQRSISRRHAKLFRRGSKFFLGEEIGTMNSTFLNGARRETGVPAEVRPGDELRFGVVILQLQVP